MKQITALKNWDFTIDNIKYSKKVTLSHTWNVDDNLSVQNYRGEAKYDTAVQIENPRNKTAYLYFGAAFHTATVYINGIYAGEHTDSGYTPFVINISRYIASGINNITVAVNNQSNEKMLPHGLDYDWADDGGLIRDAKMIICDEDDLLDMRVSYNIDSIKNDVCCGQLYIDIKTVPQDIKIEIIDKKTGDTVISRPFTAGDKITVPFKELKLWSTKEPNLYIIKAVSKNDEACLQTGFRKIEVKDAGVYLNNEKLYLKGCEWMPGSHPDYGMAEPLSHSIMRLTQLKDAGCNFTRFHWQQDTSVYKWCDEKGLLVQEEIPYWGHPKKATELQLETAKKQADEMVRFHSHHPSIVCWGVGNELGGEFPETIDYVKKMYAYFKSLDSSKLVNYVSNSVSRDSNVELDDAAMYGDIAMWNEYLGLWQPCDNIEEVIIRTYNKFGNMPSMVTEFGLCEPAFKGGDNRRTEILKERIPIYKKLKNMVGYVWFSLNDYRTHCGEYGEGKLKQRIHGSTDLYGNEKPSYKIFSEIK